MNTQSEFNIKKIHKLNLFTMITISLLMSISCFTNLNSTSNSTDLIPLILVILISVIVYYLPLKDSAKATTFSLVIIFSNFGSFLLNDLSTDISSINSIGSSINKAMEEINSGVLGTSNSINNINIQVNSANESLIESNTISNNIKSISNGIIDKVVEESKEI